MCDRDLFGHPIGAGADQSPLAPEAPAFRFGGRHLRVVRAYGDDEAAPVIVEELSDRVALKGQFALWSRQGVTRATERTKGCK